MAGKPISSLEIVVLEGVTLMTSATAIGRQVTLMLQAQLHHSHKCSCRCLPHGLWLVFWPLPIGVCGGTFCLTPDVPWLEHVTCSEQGSNQQAAVQSSSFSSGGRRKDSDVCECHLLMDSGGLSPGAKWTALSQGPKPHVLPVMCVRTLAAVCCPVPS